MKGPLPMSLTERGACRQYDAKLWFPESDNGHGAPRPASKLLAEQAIAICRRCVVRRDCLEYALESSPGDDHGIWGGTTAQERVYIRRRRQQ